MTTATTIQSFHSNAARTCQSPWTCEGIQPDTTAAMVPRGEALPPAMYCGPCVEQHLGQLQPGPPVPAEVQLCNCASTEDGFSTLPGGKTVHAWCGLPRALPIESGSPNAGLAQIRQQEAEDAPHLAEAIASVVPIPAEMLADIPAPLPHPANGVESNMAQLRAQDWERHQARVARVVAEHQVDEHEAERLITEENAGAPEQPPMPADISSTAPEATKRPRGRPKKEQGPLIVEKRDDHKWCVVHAATGTAVLTLLPSKTKATPYLGRLTALPIDWSTYTSATTDHATLVLLANETFHAMGSPLYREGLADELTAAPAVATPATGADPAGAGLGTGAAAGPVGADESGGGPEGQGTEDAGGPDQAAAGAVGSGGGGVEPGPDGGPAAVSPQAADEVGPHGSDTALPGDNGAVQLGAPGVVSGSVVTDGGSTMVVDAGGLHHGPEADCADCITEGRWCVVAEDVLWREAYGVAPQHVCDPIECLHPECVKGRTDGQPPTMEPQALDTGPAHPEPVQPFTPQPLIWTGPVGAAPDPDPAGARPGPAWLPTDVGGGPPSGRSDAGGAALAQTAATGGPPAGQGGSPAASTPAAAGPGNGAVVPAGGPVTVMTPGKASLVAFMANSKHIVMSGNTEWAARYGNELREIVKWHANNDPRSLQVHLGPSEIGHPCHRQVVGKLAGMPATNHVVDVWPSFMGRAGHKAMEDLFQAQNEREGWQRWFTERKVIPHVNHSGTSDLYDAQNFVVNDHKFIGASQMAKVRDGGGPPIHYQFQLKLYALGYRNLGYRVDRIAIICWPRTGSSIDGLYVWGHILTPADDEALAGLFRVMEWREQAAEAIRQGQATLYDVPHTPDPDDCYFCPFYRPQSARDGGPGCPGHAGQTERN